MALDLRDVDFAGPAMPEPFVRYKLEPLLQKKKLLGKESKTEAKTRQERWEVYRRHLRRLGPQSGDIAVRERVLAPLLEHLGYDELIKSDSVLTREGTESGGFLFRSADGKELRAWAVPMAMDLDAPNMRGRAYRFSPALVAQRVLLAKGERVALLTDGSVLRIVLSDPSGRDSHLALDLSKAGGWRRATAMPDSFRLLCALCQPKGVAAVGDLLDEARLAQTGVTKALREQARRAVEEFIQGLLDAPENHAARQQWHDLDAIAQQLWHEGLVLVYRLLFVLKLETSADPARAFSFAAASTWRNSYSPSTALAPIVEAVRDEGADTGGFLAASLRALFKLFAHGVSATDLQVTPLGGMLFGAGVTPLLDSLHWSERAVADLLAALLWTPADGVRAKRTDRGDSGRERVHYGTLDVEDLGRVYEALLELEPGVTAEPKSRLRRGKLEVVVSQGHAATYRAPADGSADANDEDEGEGEGEGEELDYAEGGEERSKSKVTFVEDIPAGRFYLRVGLGRKASGSYYTPHAFVRFLVQETLRPQVQKRSPHDNPKPLAILALNVLDPAMGSGHFLVEACRFLGDALYEACRLCDEHALQAQTEAEAAQNEAERSKLLSRARELWQRVSDLPDPNDELLAYLPSRVLDADEGGLSQRKALALCRRLAAVHCLYGVDKNPLAVELARVSLWLESYAEGLPLTFLDHRLIRGDSITGPFFEHLLTYPGTGGPMEELHTRGIAQRLTHVLADALSHVTQLEATIGKDLADLEQKQFAKAKLDAALAPLRVLSAAWSGGVMLGKDADDAGYEHLLRAVADGGECEHVLRGRPVLARMRDLGRDAVAYDLVFSEVFHPNGAVHRSGGFDAVLGNPPWDKLRVERRDILASLDPRYLEGKEASDETLAHSEEIHRAFSSYPIAVALAMSVECTRRACRAVMSTSTYSGGTAAIPAGDPDQYQIFLVRTGSLLALHGILGFIVGGGLAKNPADAPLRSSLFAFLRPQFFAHYHNLRQLFGGASSRISFCLFIGTRSDADAQSNVTIALDLTTFEALEHIDRAPFSALSVTALRESATSIAGVLRPKDKFTGAYDAIEGLTRRGLQVGNDLHKTAAKPAFRHLRRILDAEDARDPGVLSQLASKGFACLYDGRAIDFFDAFPTRKSGKWRPQIDLVVDLGHARALAVSSRTAYFRLAWRSTCGHPSTNARSARPCILPPGCLAGNSIILETTPQDRPNSDALIACAIISSFAFDAQVRPTIQSHLNKAVMRLARWPAIVGVASVFLAHEAMRLSAVHTGYGPLWSEQLGDCWREPKPLHAWPVLEGDARWVARANIDAIVAAAYGLSREQYAHVLSSFSHTSHPNTPPICLAAFDELKRNGVEAFAKDHDPYFDVPLVSTHASPVVDLRGKANAIEASDSFVLRSPPVATRTKRARKERARR